MNGAWRTQAGQKLWHMLWATQAAWSRRSSVSTRYGLSQIWRGEHLFSLDFGGIWQLACEYYWTHKFPFFQSMTCLLVPLGRLCAWVCLYWRMTKLSIMTNVSVQSKSAGFKTGRCYFTMEEFFIAKMIEISCRLHSIVPEKFQNCFATKLFQVVISREVLLSIMIMFILYTYAV